MLNRVIAPLRHDIQDITLVQPDEVVFDNGLRVFVFSAPTQELVKAEFIFQNIFDGSENSLLHTCACQMLKEGTKTRTSTQIAAEIDFYGAYLMPEYSFDQTALTLYSLNKHLSAVLPVVHDILNDAIFPEVELETYIRNNKQTLQISLQKNDYVARRLFFKNLFGESRYGQVPTEEAYEKLNRDDLIALYQKQVQPQNCTLILSGNITDEVLAEIRELFGIQWQNNGGASRIVTPEFPAFVPTTVWEERAEALQSAIRLGMPAINRTHPDFPAIQFVNTLIGGYFGSRLMRNIREKKGFTYSIGSAFASLLHTGFFTIATEVGVDSTQATLLEIEKEFRVLRDTAVSEEEIALVRNYMLGSILGSIESVFSHADKFKAVYFYGLDLSYYTRYNEIIRNMTAADVQRIANMYFDYDNLLKVIVGKSFSNFF
ncbi:M16 family metallopeptidase [Sphingobacterium corticibacterium]|uniref:Insulinase family protein n=1 Tax=Sphingobacterium corticibacterium TaxID=2484746 RepID=A0A4Q6XYL8_9SPHI|nr:pitrilysin family protein [Sphingobacterium corticibacterium]RZF61656.1 insulinase family protein [Sphingobacterium corticibacterium]